MLAALIAIPSLGRSSLWQDEGSTWDLTGRPVGDLVGVVRHTETNGSLYNVLLTLWRDAAGDSETAMRLPSVFLLLLLVVLSARLASRLIGPRAVPWVAVLVALHGRFLEHGREARTYSLVFVLVTARSLLFVDDVERPRRVTWVAWVLLGAAAIYSHLLASMLVVAEVAAVVALPRERRRWRRRFAGWAATFALCLPLAVAVAGRDDLEGLQVLDFSFRILTSVAGALAGGSLVTTFVVAAAFVGGLVQFVRARAWVGPDGWWRCYLLAGVIAPTAILAVASLLQPVLLGRYVLYSAVPLVLFVVDFLLTIEPARRRAIVGGVLVAAMAISAVQYRFRGETENWRMAVAHMLDGARPGDLVVSADDYHLLVVDYYIDHRADTAAPLPEAVLPPIPLGRFNLEDWTYADIGAEEFACAVGGATRLWVLDGPEYFDLPRRDSLKALAEDAFGPPVEERTYTGHADVSVRLYESASPQPVPDGCGT